MPAPATFPVLRTRMVDKEGMPTREWTKQFQAWMTQVNTSLSQFGDILAAAKIQGRTEGIGTTVGQITSAGLLASADKIAADGASFARVTLNERTGGSRGYNALDANNRLANSFRANPVFNSAAPTSATVLSNTGASTAIAIAASTMQFGAGTVAYNSGSVDPGVYGAFFIYADDPTFAGGAVTYQFTTNPSVPVAADGRVYFGKILTAAGPPVTGGGNTGGTTPGGAGGRGYVLA